MNRGDIIRMAREAGFSDTTNPFVAWGASWEQVERFAALVAAAKCNPLYTAPQKREWVGLTDEEVHDLSYLFQKIDASNSEWFDRWVFARAVEAKLKEKNQ